MDSADRPDLRTSATTLYYQQRSHSARPSGTARVPAGPPPKLIGGQFTNAYEERPSPSPKPVADFSQEHTPRRQTAWADMTGTTARTSSTTNGSLYGTKKVVYWTGRDHHIVDAPVVSDSSFKWVPPHLKENDVEPGPQLGVRETPGASRVKLIGSKYRYLPTMEPYGTSMWAVSEAEATKYGSVGSNTWGSSGMPGATGGRVRPLTASGPYGGSLEAYARQRAMGYKEYESTCRSLNGLGSWERTQRHLMSSMDVGRPSKLLSPAAHSATMSMSASFTGLKAAR